MTDVTAATPETDVLVVGAGLAGSAVALMLARHGVAVTVLDRRDDPSGHPRGRLLSVRTMEILRAHGAEDAVRDAGEPPGGMITGETLAGPHERPPPGPPGPGLSPCSAWTCDQDRLEPVLLGLAREHGAHVRPGVEVTALSCDDGVTVGTSGGRFRARFVVVADGASGRLGAGAGLSRNGGPFGPAQAGMLFRADLGPALRGRTFGMFRPAGEAARLLPRGTPADRYWQIVLPLTGDEDPPPDVAGTLLPVLRRIVGLPGLDVTPVDARVWRSAAEIAPGYRNGPVFLLGDSAHVLPHQAGFGGNLAIADAHDLAWRLAAVVHREGSDALLDGHTRERRPVGVFTLHQALLRAPGAGAVGDPVDPRTVALGPRHPGSAGYDPSHPVEDPAAPSGLPGCRAPHVPLRDGRSTLDLLDPYGFTFVGAPGPPEPVGGIRLCVVGDEHVADPERWDGVYRGPGRSGLLIRPDGAVCAVLGADEPDPGRRLAQARADVLAGPGESR